MDKVENSRQGLGQSKAKAAGTVGECGAGLPEGVGVSPHCKSAFAGVLIALVLQPSARWITLSSALFRDQGSGHWQGQSWESCSGCRAFAGCSKEQKENEFASLHPAIWGSGGATCMPTPRKAGQGHREHLGGMEMLLALKPREP